jgi:hypothetical protein
MSGRPAIALGICPNDLSQPAASDLAATPAAGVNSSAPAAPPFHAKTSEDNGAAGEATMKPADSMAGSASRYQPTPTIVAQVERG